MKKNNKKIIFISIISIILMIGLMYFSNRGDSRVNVIGNVFYKISSMIYGKNDYNYDQNDLKQAKETLELKQRELEVIKAQNTQLSEMLNLKAKFSNYEGIPAEIKVKNSSNFEKTVIINVGSESGIRNNMAVVSKNGLYGKIISTEKNSSKVQLITDPSSKVSVNVGRNNLAVIASGDLKNKLILTMFPQDYKAISGDDIFTSGIGGIFPKGIYLGKVKELKYKPNDIDSYALVDFIQDFSEINKVLVLSKKIK